MTARKRRRAAKPRSPSKPVTAGATAVEMMPQAHGGALRRGNPGNRGRARAAWVEQCQKGVRDAKVLEILKKLVSGDILEVIGHTRKGEEIIGETPGHVRIHAAELLLNYAFGKPTQPVAGDDLEPLAQDIRVILVRPEPRV